MNCKYSEIAQCNEKVEPKKPISCLCCLSGAISLNYFQLLVMLQRGNFKVTLDEARFVLNGAKAFREYQLAILKLMETEFPQEYASIRDTIQKFNFEATNAYRS
jgi:hypothetical protein